MRVPKERLTVTVDRDLIEEAEEAIREGRAHSMSGYVNSALAEYSAKQRRLAALARAIKAYEAEFGEITKEEMDERVRLDKARAIVVRGNPAKAKKRRRTATG